MVYKKIFTCFVTGSVIVLTFAFFTAIIFILTVGYVPFGPIRHNRNFSKELNQAVINLVDQVITIQYKTHCQETLVKIFTEELIKNYDNYIHNFFREESFYFSRNYMRTLHYSGNNQWSVSVAMHEGSIVSGHSFFLNVIIVRTESGSYLINSIGKDA